jgi:hypothetical protein
MNIGLVGHDLKFLSPIISAIKNRSDWTLKIFEYEGHQIPEKVRDDIFLKTSNVIFCEWLLSNAIWFSNNIHENQKLIIRLHAQEIRNKKIADVFSYINWDNVYHLIVISPEILDQILGLNLLPPNKISCIPNSIPFNFNPTEKQNKMNSRYVLGMVGIVPALKRLDIAFDLIRELFSANKNYTLRIKTKMPSDFPWMLDRKGELSWYEEIFHKNRDLITSQVVIFDPYNDQMEDWYKNIGHIISTSDSEGSHQAIAEGMFFGCIPAIRSWQGASRIYPPEFIGSNFLDLSKLILAATEIDNFLTLSEASRNFSFENFSYRTTVDPVLNLFQ